MIKYEFDPDTQHQVIETDLTNAFKNAKGMTDFIVNCGIEAQEG